MRYLLDTNVCADYLNGRYPAVALRIQGMHPDDLATSSVVAAELRYGAEKSAQRERNHSRIEILLSEIRCLDFDLSAATVYGSLRATLERRGISIGAHDLLIAAQALSADLVLVSNVRELARIKGLAIENWR